MRKFTILFLPVLLILLSTCKKEKSNPCDATVAANLPAVSIDSVYRDNDNRIVITGNVLGVGQDDAGLTAHGVVWSQNLTPSLQNGQSKDLGDAAATGRFTVTLDSLPPGDYQFRTYATNCTGTQYSGAVKNLMVTVQGKPFVQVNDHYLISATGNDGIINPGDDVQYGFTVQNVGTLKADAVTATLYTAATQYIGNLSPASLNIGALNAGGAISNAQTLSFKVAANTPPGQYCLNVDIDADGETNPDTICFEVVQKVVANFTVQNDGCDAPCSVSFANTSQGATSYVWDFGDGSAVSTETNPNHEYKKSGTYTVKLTATGPAGINFTNQTIQINAITFNRSLSVPNHSCGGGTYVFETASGYRIFGYFCAFGNSSAVVEVDQNGLVTFSNPIPNSNQAYTEYIVPDPNNANLFYGAVKRFNDFGGDGFIDISTIDSLGNVLTVFSLKNFELFSFIDLGNQRFLVTGTSYEGTTYPANIYQVFIADFGSTVLDKIYQLEYADTQFYPGAAFVWNQKFLLYYMTETNSVRKNYFVAINQDGSGGTSNLYIKNEQFRPLGGAPAEAGSFFILGHDSFDNLKLRHFSLNGNILNTELIPNSFWWPRKLFIAKNGDLVLYSPTSGNDNKNTIELYRISPSGLIKWHRTFYFDEYPFISGLTETSDGGFIMTGSIDGNRIFLMKTDHEGNVH